MGETANVFRITNSNSNFSMFYHILKFLFSSFQFPTSMMILFLFHTIPILWIIHYLIYFTVFGYIILYKYQKWWGRQSKGLTSNTRERHLQKYKVLFTYTQYTHSHSFNMSELKVNHKRVSINVNWFCINHKRVSINVNWFCILILLSDFL